MPHGNPEYSRETATYGGGQLVFQTPDRHGIVGIDSATVQYLAQTGLPDGLKKFAQGCFERRIIIQLAVDRDVISFFLSPYLPDGQEVDAYTAVDRFVQALSFFMREPLNSLPWHSQPRIMYARGEGFDLNSTGRGMARMMDLVCAQ